MCEYCKTDETGDIIGDYLVVDRCDNFKLYALMFPSTSSIGFSVNYKSERIIDKEIEINYCPMCGRKLKGKVVKDI